MWELDCEESWAPKNWCFWTVVLEKTLESPLDCKRSNQSVLKGDQSWMFIGRTDVEAEAPIFWLPDAKKWVIRKDLNAGKDWGQEEKEKTEDEMVGWHHWLDGHEFEQASGICDGQGNLAFCSPWDRKESDMAEQLNFISLGFLSIQLTGLLGSYGFLFLSLSSVFTYEAPALSFLFKI